MVMGKVLRFIKKGMHELVWWWIGLGWKLWGRRYQAQQVSNTAYSIGVVTYINRYHIHFIPLMRQLTALFPDTHIVVAINGYYDQEKQAAYLKEVQAFLAQYTNVIAITYNEGQSLSKLWNQLIIHSPTPKNFIFNDDIKLAPNFRQHLEKSGVLQHDVAIMNASWSHFLTAKATVQQYGWFDERFPGVGYEDHDYEIRMAIAGHAVKDITVKGLKNLAYVTKDFSWEKNPRVIFNKYSGVNGDHYAKKWSIAETAAEGYTKVRIVGGYAKLNEGMETPDFYAD